VLDVTFGEDQCRARKDHAAQNLAMLRKVTLSLLKQDTTIKDTLRGKRYRAALDETVLEAILFPENSKRGSPGGGFRCGKISLGLREDRPSLAPATMARKEFTILNKLGIHARPAAQFVKTANKFSADIFVEKDGEEVDGKSIMGLMMLAAGHGSVITVSADGEDADAAIAAIGDLIERKFEED
jgi:phosphocarrier protein